MSGIALMFFSAYIENHALRFINLYPCRNLLTSLALLFSSLVLLGVALFFGLKQEEFLFLGDWKFYLLLGLELSIVLAYRESYHANPTNFLSVNIVATSTIFLMPLYAFFMNARLDFNPKNNIPYESPSDAILFSLLLLGFYLLYFYDKRKGARQLHRPWLLVLLVFSLLNTMYFAIKMMQTYNGMAVYLLIDGVLALLFALFAWRRQEWLPAGWRWERAGALLFFGIAMLCSLAAAQLLAVELVTLYKRIGQILSGALLDRRSGVQLGTKDWVLVGLAVGGGITYSLL